MTPHAFDPEGAEFTPASTLRSAPAVVAARAADRAGSAGPQAFEVWLQFPTGAARASGFEVVAAEAQVADAGTAGRLGRVVEVAAYDLVVRVDDAADPDAALEVATEALRESLVTFRVTAVAAVPPVTLAPGTTASTVGASPPRRREGARWRRRRQPTSG